MLQKKLSKKEQIPLLIFLLGLLVSIRAFENDWFYDPFINYFQAEFSHLKYPNYNELLLFVNWVFRYFLNSVLTMAIIYVIFQELQMVKFSAFLFFGILSHTSAHFLKKLMNYRICIAYIFFHTH